MSLRTEQIVLCHVLQIKYNIVREYLGEHCITLCQGNSRNTKCYKMSICQTLTGNTLVLVTQDVFLRGYGDKTFACSCIRSWDSLPQAFRDITSPHVFKMFLNASDVKYKSIYSCLWFLNPVPTALSLCHYAYFVIFRFFII